MKPSDDADWFERVLDAMEDLVLVKGERSRLLWANRAFRTFYGMSNEELRKVLDGPQAHPDDTLQYVRDDHRVLTTAQPLRVMEPVTRHDGVTEYFDTVKSAVLGSDGTPERIVAVCRPAAAQRRDAAEAARRSRHGDLQALRAFVDALPAAVLMTDATGRPVTCSAAWAEAFGSLAEAPTVSLNGLLLDSLVQRVLREREPVDLVDRPLDAEPDARRFDLLVRTWTLSDGRLGGAVVKAREVTQLRQRERHLAQLNAELAQLAYRTSHDLVSPLRASIGWIDMAQEDLDGGDTLSGLTALERARGRLEQLTVRVRELTASIKADLVDEAPVNVDLREEVQRVLEGYAPDARAVDVTLRNEVPSRHLLLPAVRFREILARLVDNGIKFREPTRPGFVAVSLEGGPERWSVLVSDDGVGLPDPEDVDIFGLFVRASNVPGHGLGLHAARKMARAMGGDLGVAQGARRTTFVLALPRPRGSTEP